MRRLASLAAATISASAIALAGAAPAGAANADVSISSTGCTSGHTFCYKPPSLSVADGTTVVWTDDSSSPHTVTRCSASSCGSLGAGSGTDSTFTSGSTSPNGTFSHTFHGTGTYNYYCTIHGFNAMHGTVTVTAPK